MQKRVLIIDDEIDLCLLLKSFFNRKGFEVQIYHTLNEGMAFIDNYQPDILLLDHNLPDSTGGWSAAPLLATKYPEMFIVLMSAYHSVAPEMPETARYIKVEKPVSLKDLEERLALP